MRECRITGLMTMMSGLRMHRSPHVTPVTFFKNSAQHLQQWVFPIVVVLLYLISFGWALPSLGFYLDDWPHIYYQKFGGSESIYLFHAYDGRPLLGWFYVGVSEILGFSPMVRQIFSLVLRFLTVIILWRGLRLIWPKLSWQMDAAALLFAVYPIFAQQPVSVAFSSHWAAFLCLMLSFYFMLLTFKCRKLLYLFAVVSVVFEVVHYSLSEYFIAVDFLRFILLYIFGANNLSLKNLREKVLWTFRHSLIYWIVGFSFIVWRVFFLELPRSDRIAPVFFQSLAHSPLAALQQLLIWVVRDFFLNIVISWYKTFTIEMLDFESNFATVSLIMTFLVWVVCTLYLRWRHSRGESHSQSWIYQGIVAGFLFTLIAPLPGWVTGRSSSLFVGPMSDRFGLPAMFGASILLTALVDSLVRKTGFRILILALSIGLATGWQARNTNEFRWSAILQQRFFHQLILRVPGLESDSIIASEQEFLPKVGGYPLSYALNSLYANSNTERFNYYYINLSKEYPEKLADFANGELIMRQRWQSKFTGKSTQGIVIEYRPDEGRCLWVLDESESRNPLLPEITRKVLSASDLSRILPDSQVAIAREIFGEPNPDTWCELYQQAALGAQLKNWDKVIDLWELSKSYRHQINATTELKPFIEAYLHKGNLAQSFELSQQLNQGIKGGANDYLCSIWESSLSIDERPLAKRYIEEWDCEFLEGKN